MKLSKKKLLILSCAGAAILLVVFLAVNVGFWCNEDCISVAFDKAAMKKVDRAAVIVDGTEYPITDPWLIRQLADQTVVSTHTLLCNSQEGRWIELYDGDKLVRRMNWEQAHDGVIVYASDQTHWIFGEAEYGQTYLTQEVLDALYEAIGQIPTPYCSQTARGDW